MEIETLTHHEIVKKLVGPIDPIGESQTDRIRFENLQVMTDLISKLLTDVDDIVVLHKHSYEGSRIKAAKFASDFYDKLGIVE